MVSNIACLAGVRLYNHRFFGRRSGTA